MLIMTLILIGSLTASCDARLKDHWVDNVGEWKSKECTKNYCDASSIKWRYRCPCDELSVSGMAKLIALYSKPDELYCDYISGTQYTKIVRRTKTTEVAGTFIASCDDKTKKQVIVLVSLTNNVYASDVYVANSKCGNVDDRLTDGLAVRRNSTIMNAAESYRNEFCK